jgi:glycolate oxidase FAD binding subunit
MMPEADLISEITQRVADARGRKQALVIRGGNTRRFPGRVVAGEVLDIGPHRGVTEYEPTELVVTARAGTPLSELESLLAGEGQMLAFEPPRFGAEATLGGAIAAGASGPRRPYAGAARDFVLGLGCVTGRAEHLQFGGKVMKNVAGYDVARLMTGAFGTLGVITEVSLKVLPIPECELTLVHECTAAEAIARMNQWAGRPLPLSAAAHHDGCLRVRLGGTVAAVEAAARALGGERMADGDACWRALRDLEHPFFRLQGRLWRLSVPPAAPVVPLPGEWYLDWGGAQRWYVGDAAPAEVRAAAVRADGHASMWCGAASAEEAFHPLTTPLAALHRQIKRAFDPDGILNPGRMYADI